MSKQYDPKADIGVNRVRAFFLEELGWIFREQTIADIGIDAVVEVVTGGASTGDLIALQIKTGYESKRREDGSYRLGDGNCRTPLYWLTLPLPVLLVLVDPENNVILWHHVDRDDIEFNAMRTSWSVVIPASAVLKADDRSELSRIAGAHKDLKDTVQDLQETVKGLEVEFTCPFCRETLQERSYHDEWHDERQCEVAVEVFVCGTRRENGGLYRLCEGFPPLLDHFEVETRISPLGEGVWYSVLVPVTETAKRMDFRLGAEGKSEDASRIALLRRFILLLGHDLGPDRGLWASVSDL